MTIRVRIQASSGACTSLGRSAVPRAWLPLLRRGVRTALQAQGSERGEVSVTLLDDAEIAQLNRDYLKHTGATDVISFALFEPPEPVLGDIYIGTARAVAEAGARGIPVQQELLRLAIHGTLHVLGHDHPNGPGRTRSRMWRLQERVVAEVLAS